MKKLLILSGKGGTGKTTITSAFIQFGKIQAMADCDVDAPNLHILNHFNKAPVKTDYYGSKKAFIDYNKCVSCGKCIKGCRFEAISLKEKEYKISEYMCEGCGVCEYLCPTKAIFMKPDIAGEILLYKDQRVFVSAKLKMGRGNSGKLVMKVKDTLEKNAFDKDVLIIDGSPGVGCPVMASINGVDLILIVTEPTVSGKSDLERLVKVANLSRTKVAVCINKYNVNTCLSDEIQNWCKDNNIPFAGSVPYDSRVSLAVNKEESIALLDIPITNAIKKVYEKSMYLLSK